MKNWKRIAAGLLTALMIAGCGAAADTADAGLSVTADGAQVTVTSGDAEVTIVDDDVAAQEAVASRPEDPDEMDSGFTVEADTEGIDDDMAVGVDDSTIAVTPADDIDPEFSVDDEIQTDLDEDAYYYDKDSVALYLVTYHKLPSNYITKKEAQALGWEGGPLDPYAPDMAIGGDHFGNYEGLLPEDADYHECDIDTHGTKRGAKRIIYSDDWDIYYTDDHYETFTQLY